MVVDRNVRHTVHDGIHETGSGREEEFEYESDRGYEEVQNFLRSERE